MPDDEAHLIELLIAFMRVKRKKLIVYFDNAPLGVEKVQNFGYVSAHYVRSGRTADTAIVGKLRQLGKSARNWTVVSSDRAVQLEARSAGAGVASSEEFAALVVSTLKSSEKISDASREEYPDDSEVKWWLGFFNGEVENGHK